MPRTRAHAERRPAPKVCSPIDVLDATESLRCCVARGVWERLVGDAGFVALRLAGPEIQESDAPVGRHLDVLRLEVAMRNVETSKEGNGLPELATEDVGLIGR